MWRVRRSIAKNPTRHSTKDVKLLSQDVHIHKEQYLYNPTAKVFTQDEANKLFEPVQPEFAEWTADANSSIHNTMMFAPVFPLAMAILLGNLATQYWFDKFFILRFGGRPYVQSPDLAQKMIIDFDWMFVSWMVGQIIWDLWLRDELSAYTFFTIALVGAIKLFRVNQWLQMKFRESIKSKIREEEDAINGSEGDLGEENLGETKKSGPKEKGVSVMAAVDGNTPYKLVRRRFIMEYDRANPLTTLKATINWLKFVHSSSKKKEDAISGVTDAIGEILKKSKASGSGSKKFTLETGERQILTDGEGNSGIKIDSDKNQNSDSEENEGMDMMALDYYAGNSRGGPGATQRRRAAISMEDMSDGTPKDSGPTNLLSGVFSLVYSLNADTGSKPKSGGRNLNRKDTSTINSRVNNFFKSSQINLSAGLLDLIKNPKKAMGKSKKFIQEVGSGSIECNNESSGEEDPDINADSSNMHYLYKSADGSNPG